MTDRTNAASPSVCSENSCTVWIDSGEAGAVADALAAAAYSNLSGRNVPTNVVWKRRESIVPGFKERALLHHISLGRAGDRSIPYWRQGDDELDSSPNKEHRRRLREHPEVLSALKPWWDTAMRCREADDGVCESFEFQVSHARDDHVSVRISVRAKHR